MEKNKSPENCFLRKSILMSLEYDGEGFWEKRAERVSEDFKNKKNDTRANLKISVILGL